MNENQEFFVVAIGTSAGGLAVLKQVLENLPEDNNAAFIIIQHLYPNTKSSLVELLRPHTKMQVYRAVQDQTVKPACVYVLPEGKMMTIRDERLCLVNRGPEQVVNNAINIFFESMGPELKERAIGVVLTGQGTDGTAGAGFIHDNGGVVMVQTPGSAEHKGMPQSLTDSGYSNFNMPINDLIETLANLIRPSGTRNAWPLKF